jgi:hypothetical protein
MDAISATAPRSSTGRYGPSCGKRYAGDMYVRKIYASVRRKPMGGQLVGGMKNDR